MTFEILVMSRVALEKAMATHSSTLAWKIPWTEEPGRLQSMGLLQVECDRDFTFMYWRRKWQCSCLENPRDNRAWWAAVYGFTQSWTQLKQLSSSSSSSSRVALWREWCFGRILQVNRSTVNVRILE